MVSSSAVQTSLAAVSTSERDVRSSRAMAYIWVGQDASRHKSRQTDMIRIGTAFRELKAETLYPAIGFKRANEQIRVNFGELPFVYDIDGLVEVRKTCCCIHVQPLTLSTGGKTACAR